MLAGLAKEKLNLIKTLHTSRWPLNVIMTLACVDKSRQKNIYLCKVLLHV